MTGALGDVERDEPMLRAAADRAELELQALEDEERSLVEQAQMPAEGVVANLRGDLRSLEIAAERDRREVEGLLARRHQVTDRLAEEATTSQTIVADIQQVDAAAGAARDVFDETVGSANQGPDGRRRGDRATLRGAGSPQ